MALSTRILALLHAVEGDINDRNKSLYGAQGAEQPVWVHFADHLHDVPFAEAQLSRFSGDVVAQRSDFTEDRHGRKA